MLATFDPVLPLLCLGLLVFLVWVMRPWVQSRAWRTAPAELVAFVCFSALVIVAVAIVELVDPDLSERLLPYTGWVPEMLYVFGVIAGVGLCRTRNRVARVGLIVFLGVWAAGHVIEFMTERGRTFQDNPYLRVSEYRPIWTVVIPLVWMIVLLSPRVKAYASASGRHTARRAVAQPPGEDSM